MSRADPLRVADYLQHVLEAIGNIQDYTAGMDLDAFMADRKTRDAVIRNLEVIGEACNNVAKKTLGLCVRALGHPLGLRLRNAQHTFARVFLGGPCHRLADRPARPAKTKMPDISAY